MLFTSLQSQEEGDQTTDFHDYLLSDCSNNKDRVNQILFK